jgi:hydroxyacylglutathione hydrolase
LNDNYGFLLHDLESGATASIDTPEAEAINAALQDRVQETARLRAQGIPAAPTSIGWERQTSPLVRSASSNSRATVNLVGADPLAIFAETRKRKDHF